MSTAMKVILLEKVDKLGNMGETVRVRTGYARNYLLPQNKAIRATKDNEAYFESQRKSLEKLNADKRAEAEKEAKKLEGLVVAIIRLASEGGQMYGSVSSRDIADAINAASQVEVGRSQIVVNQAFKTIGLFPVDIALHPEVIVQVTVNIARSEEEAKIQKDTGRALIAEDLQAAPEPKTSEESEQELKKALLEEAAVEAEKERAEEEAAEAAKEAEKAAAKKAKAEAKKAAEVEEADAEEASDAAEEAAEEGEKEE